MTRCGSPASMDDETPETPETPDAPASKYIVVQLLNGRLFLGELEDHHTEAMVLRNALEADAERVSMTLLSFLNECDKYKANFVGCYKQISFPNGAIACWSPAECSSERARDLFLDRHAWHEL